MVEENNSNVNDIRPSCIGRTNFLHIHNGKGGILINKIDKKDFQSSLLSWYQENKRELPWREKADPYSIWISEIMLQQTKVETVLPYFHRFIERIPTVKALAAIDDQELLKLWQGLGYYNRAANMKKAAIAILEEYNGEFPNKSELLMTLPGIGTYTAGAIASIAFGEKVAAVDGNVFRVLARMTGDEGNILQSSVQKGLRNQITELLPDNSIGDFNQALIELGALICIGNGMPRCGDCPIKNLCIAYQKGLQKILPIRLKNKERKIEYKSVVLLTSNNKIALIQRQSDAMLANLWEYPVIENFYEKEDIIKILKKDGIILTKIEEVTEAQAIFSHRVWKMKIFLAETDTLSMNYTWKVKEEISKYFPIANAYASCWKYLPGDDIINDL